MGIRPPLTLLAIATLLLAASGVGHAQAPAGPAADADVLPRSAIETVARDGYTIAGLVSQLPGVKSFKHGIVLFPGAPGILRLREADGQPRFDLRGNFLVRSSRHWLDEETLVVVVDAPSDQWAAFSQRFRESPRYGADVAALLAAIGQRNRVDNWTFVGTSEGSVSAFHAARMNPLLARRTILTASLFLATRLGPGLSGINIGDLPGDLLWVHHENDPCTYTPYREAVDFAQKSGKPLMTVRGGDPGRGPPCEAYSAHGFVGMERATVLAMRAWIKTGAVPAVVAP